MAKRTRRLAVGRATDPVTGKAIRRDGRPWRGKTGKGPTSKYLDEPLSDEQVDDGMGAYQDRKEEEEGQ